MKNSSMKMIIYLGVAGFKMKSESSDNKPNSFTSHKLSVIGISLMMLDDDREVGFQLDDLNTTRSSHDMKVMDLSWCRLVSTYCSEVLN